MGVNHGSVVAISIKRRGENRAKSLDLKALEHQNPKDAMKRAPQGVEVDDEQQNEPVRPRNRIFWHAFGKYFQDRRSIPLDSPLDRLACERADGQA